MPCSTCRRRLEIQANADTLMARYLTLPSSGALMVGYVWNVVATWAVSKVQDEGDSYHFDFFVQGAYTLIACTMCTALTVRLKRSMQQAKSQPHETGIHQLNTWAGLEEAEENVRPLVISTLSFLFGWALLDTADDWAFGVMCQCPSYSTCSYQSNFVYAMSVTVIFALSASILDKAKEAVNSESILATAVSLQVNGMILTVGWAWMNFYSTLMSDATSPSPPGMKVVLYVNSLIIVMVFHSLTQYCLQTAHVAFVQRMKEALASFEAIEKGEATAQKKEQSIDL